MPDTDDLKKTVDLDTSGPAMDVDVPETKEEDVIEQKEAPVEEPTVRAVEENPVEDRHEEKKDDKRNGTHVFFTNLTRIEPDLTIP